MTLTIQDLYSYKSVQQKNRLYDFYAEFHVIYL